MSKIPGDGVGLGSDPRPSQIHTANDVDVLLQRTVQLGAWNLVDVERRLDLFRPLLHQLFDVELLVLVQQLHRIGSSGGLVQLSDVVDPVVDLFGGTA